MPNQQELDTSEKLYNEYRLLVRFYQESYIDEWGERVGWKPSDSMIQNAYQQYKLYCLQKGIEYR